MFCSSNQKWPTCVSSICRGRRWRQWWTSASRPSGGQGPRPAGPRCWAPPWGRPAALGPPRPSLGPPRPSLGPPRPSLGPPRPASHQLGPFSPVASVAVPVPVPTFEKLLPFQLRFQLLPSYGVPVPVPHLDHKKHSFEKKCLKKSGLLTFWAFLQGQNW